MSLLHNKGLLKTEKLTLIKYCLLFTCHPTTGCLTFLRGIKVIIIAPTAAIDKRLAGLIGDIIIESWESSTAISHHPWETAVI